MKNLDQIILIVIGILGSICMVFTFLGRKRKLAMKKDRLITQELIDELKVTFRENSKHDVVNQHATIGACFALLKITKDKTEVELLNKWVAEVCPESEKLT